MANWNGDINDIQKCLFQARNGKSKGWNGTLRAPHKSIWSADYKPAPFVNKKPEPQPVKHVSTVGQKMQVDVSKKITVQRPTRSEYYFSVLS